jgi:hypothetical protein
MKWLQMVGMVRWRRTGRDLKENLSGGVGFVRWCRFGMWNETWDLSALYRSQRSISDVVEDYISL